ncbi:biotin transporter BioY [Myxococcus sp. AS-1-15]|uniref:biotin transporter BioY n=1 Tax=Myxococcus sp. AS-1-15 TaxID=2874600 RepID=UPI001CC0C4D9
MSSRSSRSSHRAQFVDRSTVSANVPTRHVLTDMFVRTRTHEVAVILGAALCTALFAQVAISVPGSPVPVTGQTLAVVVTAAALGPRRGMLGQLAYLLLGAVGLPFFAKAASGWGALLGPTGGYLVGFIPTAFLVGLAARRGYDRRLWTAVPLFLAGQLLVLVIGMCWLSVAKSLDLATAFQKGFVPFLPGGLLKALIAGVLTHFAWRFARAREV